MDAVFADPQVRHLQATVTVHHPTLGEQQVLVWRRAYAIAPDPLTPADPRWAGSDPRYRHLKPEQIPATECLRDTVDRVVPFWSDPIAPALRAGRRVPVAAHGNPPRALV